MSAELNVASIKDLSPLDGAKTANRAPVWKSIVALIDQSPMDWIADEYTLWNARADISLDISFGMLGLHLKRPGSALLGWYGGWRVWRAYKRWLRWHFEQKCMELAGCEFTTAELPRWKPHITIDRRTFEDVNNQRTKVTHES